MVSLHETNNIERLIQSLKRAQIIEKQIKKIGGPPGGGGGGGVVWEANKQMHHFDKKIEYRT